MIDDHRVGKIKSMRDNKEGKSGEEVITTVCRCHCGGSCVLKAHVRDGVITRIETDDGDEPQLRACLRGRAWRQRVYGADRITHPMERIGERGRGEFKQTTWDKALDRIATEIERVRKDYGPEALLFTCSGGDEGMVQDTGRRMGRLFAMLGAFVDLVYGTASFEGSVSADMATFGTYWTGSSRDDLLNSRFIIMWGWDPAATIHDTNTTWYLKQAKETGIRIVSVDPRYTPSAAAVADQWIPIRPGTDTAMMVAMAHTIITEGLQDQAFLDRYTVGFNKFRDYVLGSADGYAKTPEWAEPITGVAADTIRQLAREYASTKPACLIAGIGPGRSAHGEQYHRAAITLSAMTRNIGTPGGSSGSRSWGNLGLLSVGLGMKIPRAVQPYPSPKEKLPNRANAPFGKGIVISCMLPDVVSKGKAGGYPADYRLLYVNNCNLVNQWPNTNKTVEALKKLEFIAVEEQFMTATARFADIVLPSTTLFEQCDVIIGASTPAMYGYRKPVIPPVGECRPQLDIAEQLAGRLNLTDYNSKTADEWCGEILKGSYVEDVEALRRSGYQVLRFPEPHVAFRKEIEDPDNNPFPTPSGKIEIYSQMLADMHVTDLPPIPEFVDNWESLSDPLAAEYPLQLVTTHSKRRAHSQYDSIPWLRETDPHSVRMNPADAASRGIENGDMVRIFNGRGQMVIPAKLVETIMPGVVDIPQGAWYAPDEKGVDRGGCCNVLTLDRPSPGGAWPTNTALVQIEKA